MPRALDPQNRYPVVLEADAAKPNGQRPTFHFRYLTCREEMKLGELGDKLRSSANAVERAEALFACLRLGLCGWEQMGEAYDPQRLEDLLSLEEAAELFAKMAEGLRPGAADLKKSGSPSPSEPASSASGAAAASVANIPEIPGNSSV